MNQKRFENYLLFGLVAAAMFEPFAAAIGILILVTGQAAERYFTKNISDSDRERLSVLEAEIKKVNEILQKQGLATAFGRKQA